MNSKIIATLMGTAAAVLFISPGVLAQVTTGAPGVTGLPGNLETMGGLGILGVLIYLLQDEKKGRAQEAKDHQVDLVAKEKEVQAKMQELLDLQGRILEQSQADNQKTEARFWGLMDRLTDRVFQAPGGAP